MRKTSASFAAALLLVCADAHAVRGVVVDAATCAPIAGAFVTLGGSVVRTAPTGNFRIDGPGTTLGIRAYGYERRQIPLAGRKDGGTLDLVAFRPKALYLSFYGIGNRHLRQAALDVVRETSVNALVIDVKGDRGMISYKTNIPLAIQIGAQRVTTIANIRRLLSDLHKAGIYTIARIVVFKDDILALAKPGLAIRNANGTVWKDREGLAWIDPFDTQAWDYDIDIAIDAAKEGFDEIQFDYVRFPDSKGLAFSQANTRENRVSAIMGFLAKARKRLSPYNVFLAADIFGYTIWNPGDTGIGQDLPVLAGVVDYVSPMLYPSGFQYGIPGYSNPVLHPDEIVARSLRKAMARTALAPVRFRPWLQAFRDYAFGGRPFGGPEISAQIDAAEALGSDGWMLWNPKNVYSAAGLPPKSGATVSSVSASAPSGNDPTKAGLPCSP